VVVGLVIWRIIFYGASQKGYPGMTLIMVTFGIAMLVEGLAFIVLGTDIRVTPYYIKIPPIRLYRATFSPQAPLIYGVILLMVIGLYILFHRTLLGKGLRACHEQLLAARLSGINPRKMMYYSYILAVSLGAISGVVMVPFTAASYSMGMHMILKGFLAAIVGGITTFQGVISAGLALGILESLAAGFISSSYASIIAYAIFVSLLIFRPHGLLGTEQIRV
jgi:branched-chain amino acid transport system permease protein